MTNLNQIQALLQETNGEIAFLEQGFIILHDILDMSFKMAQQIVYSFAFWQNPSHSDSKDSGYFLAEEMREMFRFALQKDEDTDYVLSLFQSTLWDELPLKYEQFLSGLSEGEILTFFLTPTEARFKYAQQVVLAAEYLVYRGNTDHEGEKEEIPIKNTIELIKNMEEFLEDSSLSPFLQFRFLNLLRRDLYEMTLIDKEALWICYYKQSLLLEKNMIH